GGLRSVLRPSVTLPGAGSDACVCWVAEASAVANDAPLPALAPPFEDLGAAFELLSTGWIMSVRGTPLSRVLGRDASFFSGRPASARSRPPGAPRRPPSPGR